MYTTRFLRHQLLPALIALALLLALMTPGAVLADGNSPATEDAVGEQASEDEATDAAPESIDTDSNTEGQAEVVDDATEAASQSDEIATEAEEASDSTDAVAPDAQATARETDSAEPEVEAAVLPPLPENTSVLVLDEANQPLSLAAQETADVLASVDFGNVPLSFIPNAGQSDGVVIFQARSQGGADIFFTNEEVVFALPGAQDNPTADEQENDADSGSEPQSQILRLQFYGANPNPTVVGQSPQAGVVNYLLGADLANWQTNLPTYAEVVYEDLYPGIDLVYDGTEELLERIIIEDEILRAGFAAFPYLVMNDTTLSVGARFTYGMLLQFGITLV